MSFRPRRRLVKRRCTRSIRLIKIDGQLSTRRSEIPCNYKLAFTYSQYSIKIKILIITPHIRTSVARICISCFTVTCNGLFLTSGTAIENP